MNNGREYEDEQKWFVNFMKTNLRRGEEDKMNENYLKTVSIYNKETCDFLSILVIIGTNMGEKMWIFSCVCVFLLLFCVCVCVCFVSCVSSKQKLFIQTSFHWLFFSLNFDKFSFEKMSKFNCFLLSFSIQGFFLSFFYDIFHLSSVILLNFLLHQKCVVH